MRPALEEGASEVPAEKTMSWTLGWSRDRLAIVSVSGHMNLGKSSGDEVERVFRDGAFRILGVEVTDGRSAGCSQDELVTPLASVVGSPRGRAFSHEGWVALLLAPVALGSGPTALRA